MSEVTDRGKVPIISLHSHLSNRDIYDSGIIWWDVVHMTSYGQQKAAEFIANGLLERGIVKHCS